MSIMGRIARPQAAITSSNELGRLMMEIYGGGTSATGLSVTSESAMRVGAVYSCVLVLSQSVAQLPLHLYREEGENKKKDTENRLYQLVHDQPNEWMTSYEMKQLIMVHLLLRGNSVWLKTKGTRGDVREIIPIHPDRIDEIVQDEYYRLSYKIRRPGNSGQVDTIPGSSLVHFRGISTNGFSGLNPIQYAREMIGLSMATEKHGAKLFANGARLGGILSHPGKISKQAADRLTESFNSSYAGVENAHRTALIEEGMTWSKVTMTAEDAQFLESRKYQRSEIAGFYRVPPHMIGDLEKATFSNIEHQDLAFVKHALSPWLMSTEQTFKKDLLTPAEKKSRYFKYNTGGLLRGDTKSRYEALGIGIDKEIINPNEARSIEDMSPYPGGEEYRTRTSTVKETAGTQK